MVQRYLISHWQVGDPRVENLSEKEGKGMAKIEEPEALLVEVIVHPSNALSSMPWSGAILNLLSFFMGLRTFLYSRLSVFYYDQLLIKSCLVVLSQKRKKFSLGGN